MAPTGLASLRLYGLAPSRSTQHTSPSTSLVPLTSPLTTPTSDGNSTSERSFTHPTAPMPPPGPSHYEARRALWLAPPAVPPRPPSPSTSRAKLEALLSKENAVDDDHVWNSGLRSVWKGLVGGGRLRRRLPLGMVIKILKAGWLRDGTWSADAITGSPSPAPQLLSAPQTESPRGNSHNEGVIMDINDEISPMVQEHG